MRDRTYKYRIEFATNDPNNAFYCTCEWRVKSHHLWGKGYGKPSKENLAVWIRDFEESVINGPNKHLQTLNFQVVAAKIVEQETQQVVASWSRN